MADSEKIGLGVVPASSKYSSPDVFTEKHYRISELAELWGVGRETVRRLVMDEPGVIHIRQGKKKANTTYSVPASVARRIHTRLESSQ